MPVMPADRAALLATLSPLARLALAYTPTAARDPWLTLLALDARLASVVRRAREPLLAQIRLAWWRDRLNAPLTALPSGEPLLAMLASWRGQHAGLAALVDGWEALIAPPLSPSTGAVPEVFAKARMAAVAALATLLVDAPLPAAQAMARGWALVDLGAYAGLLTPEDRAALAQLIAEHDTRGPRLPRALRPLVVLHGLGRDPQRGLGGFLKALRLGLWGL